MEIGKLGGVVRMDFERTVKKVLESKPGRKRKRKKRM
jgi:hypothetical protein